MIGPQNATAYVGQRGKLIICNCICWTKSKANNHQSWAETYLPAIYIKLFLCKAS